jgi:hypothetical protein
MNFFKVSLLKCPVTNNSQENLSPTTLESTLESTPSISPIVSDTLVDNKSSPTGTLSSRSSTNRWTRSETRMLIEEVGSKQQALQRVRDPREKGRIWDKIISNLQNSTIASSTLKERSKTSIQQKWEALHQKYRNIKDIITSTGEEATQNDWEFYQDMDEILKNDPSITAPVTSDSINGIKRKGQNNTDDERNEDNEVIFIYL